MPSPLTLGQGVTEQPADVRPGASKSTASLPADPLPKDISGQRLCEIFGSYLYCSIYADAPQDTTQKPSWHTQRRYKLKNRVLYRDWQDPQKLIGVRPGHSIAYALLDIDINSPYHPKQDADAIAQIEAALETIGITRTLRIRSSWSEGIHLYLPLPESVKTFDLAVALKNCLVPQGFKLKPGHLECFPNVKAYGNLIKTEYLAHRLPLQPASGSCLLDEAFNPTSHSLKDFLDRWDTAAVGQGIATLRQALPLARKNRLKKVRNRLNKIESWKQDLETLLAEGWSGPGQTNQLLKEFGCYGHVFLGHSGEALTDFIYQQAIASPGYQRWCRHQREITMRSHVWATAIEKYYWPVGSYSKTRPTAASNTPSFNDLRAQSAQSSIQSAVQRLKSANELPHSVTARAAAIRKAQASIGETSSSLETLYKEANRKLWHPDFDAEDQATQSVIPMPPSVCVDHAVDQLSNQDQLKAPENTELRTTQKIMKCLTQPDALASSKTKFNSGRGVRGDFSSFPQSQAVQADLPTPEKTAEKVSTNSSSTSQLKKRLEDFSGKASCTILPAKLRRDKSYLNKSPISPSIADIISTTQSVVQRLNWSVEQIQGFIASKFQGRRRSQLSDEEALELLYHLQVQDIKISSG